MNMRVVNTLIKKDFKNCFSNKNLLASLAIPVGFCILYNYLFSGIVGLESTYVLQMCAIFAIAIVPTTILPVMIAEEKEKYTLRSLMLAKVSGLEFLAAKLEVCLTLTLIEALLVFFLAGGQRAQLPLYLLMVLLSTLGLSFLGTIAGLAAKDQASAGTVGAPLLLIALIPPLFSGLSDMLAKFAVLVPTTSFQTIFFSALDGKPVFSGGNPLAFAVCLVWIAAGYTVFHVFYKKRGMDY